MDRQKQPWLNSAANDAVFILSPPFISLVIVFLFPEQFQQAKGIPLAYWVFLIVFIDVAHVYSTLYRTYFNAGNFLRESPLLIAVPLGCYFVGVIIYAQESLLFWRILAYLAVYHFIRQQYGFMRLYSRYEHHQVIAGIIDKTAIYIATLYPLIFWHLNTGRNFNWFVEDDFIHFKNDRLLQYSEAIYLLVITTYVIKEMILIIRQKRINLPRNLVIAGTFLSWYFGIVYFNGDMAFTTLNVISHGIPYMALIWFFEKQKTDQRSKIMRLSFKKNGIVYFLIPLILFAYLEEGLWDGLIWKEHEALFSPFSALPRIADHQILTFLVPLLALPQATHYVLDGFIWRAKRKF